MIHLIKPADWRPEGIKRLEPPADRAVKAITNTLVVAGPGAGKTELLAQRACYLLKTGLCPAPRRILAISFKRDAARNLRERVQMRCGSELARRFDSLTFDAFSKGLVDRFLDALPTIYRPTHQYTINLKIERGMRELLNTLPAADNSLTIAQMQGIGEKRFYRGHFLVAPLALPLPVPSSIHEAAAQELWRRLLHKDKPSQLDFPMIGRLAELVVRQNPLIQRAIHATYSFVFLDEFQDTTNIHYDLTCGAFGGSDAILTAVGDDKQRIMGWAGALQGIFEKFRTDFGASVESLRVNHRSAPELVRMQHYLIHALDASAPMPEASAEKSSIGGECRVIVYEDHTAEANHLAQLIAGWIQNDQLRPRDICLLVRQTPERYMKLLTEALLVRNIRSRIENELQDLLTEPLTLTLLAFLRLSVAGRCPTAWNVARQCVYDVWGIDSAHATAFRIERAITLYCKFLAIGLPTVAAEPEAVKAILGKIMEFVGIDRFRNQHPQYRQGNFYDETLTNCARFLAEARSLTPTWPEALDHFEGTDSVPIMTIHKSKGLEYNTVVFVGLEDSALWNFRVAPEDETCGFFVAFSRAIARVVFTFSQMRPRHLGVPPEGQSRDAIASLYDLLTQAGVAEEHVGELTPAPTESADCPHLANIASPRKR